MKRQMLLISSSLFLVCEMAQANWYSNGRLLNLRKEFPDLCNEKIDPESKRNSRSIGVMEAAIVNSHIIISNPNHYSDYRKLYHFPPAKLLLPGLSQLNRKLLWGNCQNNLGIKFNLMVKIEEVMDRKGSKRFKATLHTNTDLFMDTADENMCLPFGELKIDHKSRHTLQVKGAYSHRDPQIDVDFEKKRSSDKSSEKFSAGKNQVQQDKSLDRIYNKFSLNIKQLAQNEFIMELFVRTTHLKDHDPKEPLAYCHVSKEDIFLPEHRSYYFMNQQIQNYTGGFSRDSTEHRTCQHKDSLESPLAGETKFIPREVTCKNNQNNHLNHEVNEDDTELETDTLANKRRDMADDLKSYFRQTNRHSHNFQRP
jgi:hypothetical protein